MKKIWTTNFIQNADDCGSWNKTKKNWCNLQETSFLWAIQIFFKSYSFQVYRNIIILYVISQYTYTLDFISYLNFESQLFLFMSFVILLKSFYKAKPKLIAGAITTVLPSSLSPIHSSPIVLWPHQPFLPKPYLDDSDTIKLPSRVKVPLLRRHSCPCSSAASKTAESQT